MDKENFDIGLLVIRNKRKDLLLNVFSFGSRMIKSKIVPDHRRSKTTLSPLDLG